MSRWTWVRDFVVKRLGDPQAVAVLEETGQEKKSDTPPRSNASAADAQRDEESGNDEPPSWSVQPAAGPSDRHA